MPPYLLTRIDIPSKEDVGSYCTIREALHWKRQSCEGFWLGWNQAND